MKKLSTILLLAVFAFSCKMGKNYKGTVRSVAKLRGPDGPPDVSYTLTTAFERDKVAGRRQRVFTINGNTPGPVIEAEQIVDSLRARDVPVEYVLFPDEGHGWRKLPNRIRSTTAIVSFFERTLGVTE
mgnify:CR=1 FL=1